MKKKIALLTTGWSYEYIFAVMDGIKKAIQGEEIDLYLFLCYGYYDETPAFNQGEYNIFNLIDYKDFDGVILFSNIFNSLEVLEREKAKIEACHVPAVSLEYEVDGIDYVGTDNYSGMHEMVEHLIVDHGVKDFAYIGGPDDNYESLERQGAFMDALKEHQITPKDGRITLHGNWSYNFAYDVTSEMLKDKENLPEAIVCVNDEGAIAAITCLYKNGLSVPQDIMVVGFDDTESAAVFTPSISTVNRNWNILGENALIHLLKMMQGEPVAHKTVLPSSAVKRESCGCVSGPNQNQKNYCMNKFYLHRVTLAFNGHVRHIEENFIEIEDPKILWEKIRELFAIDHEFEGENFCIAMEKDVIATEIELGDMHKKTEGYSDELQVIVNIQNGKEMPCGTLKTKDLIPEGMHSSENSVFIFNPFHYRDTTLGYFVCKNNFALIDNRFGYDWSKGISNGITKFGENYTYALMNRKLNELYMSDSMTGLLNRLGYKRMGYSMFRYQKALRHNIVIIFVDINSLKAINDNFGHLHGDLAIKTVAEIIQKYFPDEWLKIRYGGDEFLLIGSNTDEEQVSQFCAAADNGLTRRGGRMKLPYELTISSGYKIIESDSGLSLDEAVSQADQIMYERKMKYYKEKGIKR